MKSACWSLMLSSQGRADVSAPILPWEKPPASNGSVPGIRHRRRVLLAAVAVDVKEEVANLKTQWLTTKPPVGPSPQRRLVSCKIPPHRQPPGALQGAPCLSVPRPTKRVLRWKTLPHVCWTARNTAARRRRSRDQSSVSPILNGKRGSPSAASACPERRSRVPQSLANPSCSIWRTSLKLPHPVIP